MGTKRSVRGFTLIELLVVIAVIALLLTILSPIVKRAKVIARYTVCATRLHEIGNIAAAFAASHKSRFPMAYVSDWDGSFAYPVHFNYGTTVATGDDALEWDRWTRYGTPFQQLEEEYGLRAENVTCPGREDPVRGAFQADINWNWVYNQHYMYVGGLEFPKPRDPFGHHNPYPQQTTYNWGTKPPAKTLRSANLSESVLAADEVYWGGMVGGWQDAYRINHVDGPNKGSQYSLVLARPLYQNIVFGDGHVEGMDEGYYPEPLEIGNHALRHAGNGAFFYWNPTEAYAP